MKKVNISESANYMGENEEDDGKGFSKVPIEQINLNTEPISIISDFNYNFFDNNIKSYIRVFLGFVIFVIFLLLISTLSGKFHYDKPEINNNNENNNTINNTDSNDSNFTNEDEFDNNSKNESNLNLRFLESNDNIQFYLEKYNLNINNNFQ